MTARRRVSEEGRNLIDSSRESRHIAGESTRTDSEMTIRIGIWTELSTNTRDGIRIVAVLSGLRRMSSSTVYFSLFTDHHMWKSTCFVGDEGGKKQ